MKYIFLLLLFFTACSLRGSDTLTLAQAYNFNVGDTFDFRIVSASTGGLPPAYINTISFERDIIVNNWVDSITHTLHIVKLVHSTNPNSVDSYDTVVISNLQTFAFYSDTVCPPQFFIDSNSVYNGRLLNGNNQVCFESGSQASYVEGLGQVLNIWGTDFTGSDILLSDSTYLIYYSKGTEHWGTPYYVANGQTLIHFNPIPETCAIWNDTVEGRNQEILSVQEQITTGNRIPFHGHTYVEMLYSADYKMYNLTDSFIIDSLIGYFRNDTPQRQTLFYHLLSDTSFFSYNFNQLVDGANCIAVDTIMIDGQRRARWTYNGLYFPFGTSANLQYVEGIGGLFGLVPVYHPWAYYYNGYSYYAFGCLTCFSICGQNIYPNDTMTACPLISGINELSKNTVNMRLYPTLNQGQFQIDLLQGDGYKFIVNDILGREVLISELQYGRNFISIENPQTGIYFWHAMDNERVVQTGKFVIANER